MSQLVNENDWKILNYLGSPISSREIQKNRLYLAYYITKGFVDTIFLWASMKVANIGFSDVKWKNKKCPTTIQLSSYDKNEILKTIIKFHHLDSLYFQIFFKSTESLELIGKLVHLKKLSIYNHHSIILPDSIGNLSNLTDLSISVINGPVHIPITLKNLKNIEKFYIGKKLEKFPKFVLNFRKLKNLSLRNNSLTSIPPSISSLLSLKKLDLSGNKLSSLPHSIENLKNLTHLNIAMNNFTKIPECIKYLKNLESIEIGDNKYISLESFKFLFSNPKLILNLEQSIGRLNIPKKIKNFWFDRKYDEIMQYYTPPINEIAQKYAQNPKSLTGHEFERLETEATIVVRDILELSLPKNDPMLKIINKKFKIDLNNGIKLMR